MNRECEILVGHGGWLYCETHKAGVVHLGVGVSLDHVLRQVQAHLGATGCRHRWVSEVDTSLRTETVVRHTCTVCGVVHRYEHSGIPR